MRAERTFPLVGIGASVLLVAFIVLAVVNATHSAEGHFPAVPPPSQLRPGRHAPSFRLSRLGGGGPVVYKDVSAEPVVVNFFASWCANCVAELHTFATTSSSHTTTEFVGIDTDDSARATAEHLVHGAGITYPIGIDANGSVAGRYLVAALPVTFFISRTGVVMGEVFGQVSAAQLTAWVVRLQRDRR